MLGQNPPIIRLLQIEALAALRVCIKVIVKIKNQVAQKAGTKQRRIYVPCPNNK